MFKVQTFYKQQAISTLSPSYREASQKKGPRRHMRFSFREAYKIFRKENEDVIISFMTFYKLKPGNI